MEIVIREIQEKDYDDVLSLGNNELNCEHTLEDIKLFYERIKADENYKTFVAVESGAIVGFVSFAVLHEIGQKVGFLIITALAVKKIKQNMGIGKALLHFTKNYAKDREIYKVSLSSGLQRTSAHNFYLRNGYSKSAWHFSKKI